MKFSQQLVNFPNRKQQAQMYSLVDFTKYLNQLHNLFQRIEAERILPNPSHEASITQYQSQTKTLQEKKTTDQNLS
jgi:hypothetical protein